MGAITIKEIRLPDGRTYKVKWNPEKKYIYVSWGGWQYIGKADSARAAVERALEYLRER